MATRISRPTTVGIRELKLHASGLVDRAARGERIVITRYGRALAQLGPVQEDGAAKSPRVVAWEAERRAFEQQLPQLERCFWGHYVAVRGGCVVDADADHEALFQRVFPLDPRGAMFIGRVGGLPQIVDMPGFTIE